MGIISDLNDITEVFLEKLSKITLNSVISFVLFSSLFSGFLFGVYSFIERSYASLYYLDITSKIIGIIINASRSALYGLLFGVIFSILVFIVSVLMLNLKKLLPEKIDKIYLWLIPSVVISFLQTFIVYYFYFSDFAGCFTKKFLFENTIESIILACFLLILTIIISSFIALFFFF